MARRVLIAAAAAAVLAASSDALCDSQFDASINYFPQSSRFVPSRATTFTVEYGQSYKKVNITSTAGGGSRIVALRVCGAPLPSNSELGLASGAAALHLELPLTRAAVLSTTQLPWIEVRA